MNKTRVRQWIKLLRSGEFRQTQGVLRRRLPKKGMCHCCLGVICEMYSVEVGGFWKDDGEFVANYTEGKDTFEDADGMLLPESVLVWVDLDQRQQGTLSVLNDDGYSFEQIADFLGEMVKRENPDAVNWEIAAFDFRGRVRPINKAAP